MAPQALDHLEYPKRLRRLLLTPEREVAVELALLRDNGEVATFNAYRVQHDNSRGPYKGGLRYHPDVDLDDVRRWVLGCMAGGCWAVWWVLGSLVGARLADLVGGCWAGWFAGCWKWAARLMGAGKHHSWALNSTADGNAGVNFLGSFLAAILALCQHTWLTFWLAGWRHPLGHAPAPL